jgi:hypothetical protein
MLCCPHVAQANASRMPPYAVCMDSALFGFVGVIAGAVTTGVVQSTAEWRKRRNDSIAAARVVYGALIDADLTVGAVMKYGRAAIGTNDRLLERHQAVWGAQRDSMARVLNVVDFHMVQASFSNLQHMDDTLEKARLARDDDGGVAALRNDPNYSDIVDTLREAERVSLAAGRTLRDRLHSRQDDERLRNLAPALTQPAAISSSD